MREDLKKEQNFNKQKNHKIEILKQDYESITNSFKDQKEST